MKQSVFSGFSVLSGHSAVAISSLFLATASVGHAQVSHTLGSSGVTTMSAPDLEAIAAMARPMEQLHERSQEIEMRAQTVTGVAEPEGTPRTMPAYAGPEERMRPSDLNFAPPETGDGIAPRNYGSGNLNTYLHYNDYLKVPYPVRYDPWRAAGKLFFQMPDGLWYHCTAAMIAPSILATAGHCVHQGGNGDAGWIDQGYYVPAFSDTQANSRFGYCNLLHLTTTDGWFNEAFLNQGYDVALAVCDYRSGTTNRFMGHRTGWFGFCYENCRRDWWFLTQIGYPGNYYGGNEMTVSQHVSRAEGDAPDFLYGTGMRGGSSGGPHVANIGEISDSSSDPGQYTDRNIIYAVTSWGYISHALKVQGASPLSGMNNDNNFRRMYNQTCVWARQNLRRRACERID